MKYKGEKGKFKVGRACTKNSAGIWQCFVGKERPLISPVATIFGREENLANGTAEMIADALNISNQTGLLPSTILKERDELLIWKKEAMMVFDPIDKFFEDRNAPLGVSKVNFLVKIAEQRDEAVGFINEFLKSVKSEEIIIQENVDNDGYENCAGRLISSAEKLIKSITESK